MILSKKMIAVLVPWIVARIKIILQTGMGLYTGKPIGSDYYAFDPNPPLGPRLEIVQVFDLRVLKTVGFVSRQCRFHLMSLGTNLRRRRSCFLDRLIV